MILMTFTYWYCDTPVQLQQILQHIYCKSSLIIYKKMIFTNDITRCCVLFSKSGLKFMKSQIFLCFLQVIKATPSFS